MFLNILVWFGIGAAIILGFAFILFFISILYVLYEKFSETGKKESESQIAFNSQLKNIIIVPTNFHAFLKETGQIKQKGFSESILEIEKLRSEFWKKDVVLPQPRLCSYDTEKFELQIKIEGNEIFRGNFKETLSDEEKLQFITQKIKDYLLKKEERVNKDLDINLLKELSYKGW
ncbi:hypothetical protein [uncultured Treponema sp.]|uniref:hypothetical protein n=1 Tax=uncultured Treponema sp. TaxID=162155 RepID=UPI0025FE86E2|nr:hypothetical protein [uncultured Treponema sp.]